MTPANSYLLIIVHNIAGAEDLGHSSQLQWGTILDHGHLDDGLDEDMTGWGVIWDCDDQTLITYEGEPCALVDIGHILCWLEDDEVLSVASGKFSVVEMVDLNKPN